MTSTHILIVDDNLDNIALLEAILRARGYPTQAVTSGEAALVAVAAAPPALMLLDVMMPDLDGYEVARRIKGDATLPFIPIILVTAKNDLRDKVHGLEQGADDFLSKPVNRAELLARVQALLRLKGTHDALHQQHQELAHVHGRLQASERQHQELVQLITHDLRGPLTALQGSLDLIKSGALGDLNPQQHAFVTLGVQNCQLLGRMVADLLDVYRMEAGHFALQQEPVALYSLAVAACTQMQGAVIERGLQLYNQLPATLPPVLGDSEALRRVLDNLLGNAIKYTDRGVITLDGGVNGLAPPGVEPPPAYVTVCVTDTGRGIPAAARPLVFDKFYRVRTDESSVRPRPRGTGLGLTFCKQTIEAHGGQIWVTPGPDDVGSRFCFLLPLPPTA